MGNPDLLDFPPFTIFLCLLALASIGYIINWHFIPSKKRLDLPYFYVGKDVVSTLEEAHEKVCWRVLYVEY